RRRSRRSRDVRRHALHHHRAAAHCRHLAIRRTLSVRLPFHFPTWAEADDIHVPARSRRSKPATNLEGTQWLCATPKPSKCVPSANYHQLSRASKGGVE